jgi:hypothetical protein
MIEAKTQASKGLRQPANSPDGSHSQRVSDCGVVPEINYHIVM